MFGEVSRAVVEPSLEQAAEEAGSRPAKAEIHPLRHSSLPVAGRRRLESPYRHSGAGRNLPFRHSGGGRGIQWLIQDIPA